MAMQLGMCGEASLDHFVRRTLTYVDSKGVHQRVYDDNLAALGGPVVLLGEPGSGKTWLLRRIGSYPDTVFRSAAAFVAHPDPAALARNSNLLVIDGLDELAAVQESDPVNQVLGQLIKAGCPSFILSCRVADWRGAVARQDIAEEYGVPPRELILEPLSRTSAVEFLTATLSKQRAEQVIGYFEEKGIPDLYGNPLTLGLFAEIAATSEELPSSRADLLERACEIMWRERNDRHDKSPLSTIDEDSALNAAGAASAALLLTGSEAIGTTPSGAVGPRILSLSEIRTLPQAIDVRPVLSSRLFTYAHENPDQVKPIHRSVAEYLGARWLAISSSDDQRRERLLALITVDSGVPASLRGVYAWLPHFDRQFASTVIATDPYGLMRYGDADNLSVDQGRQLLRSLQRLETENPFFRAEDWARHSAKGLTHQELRDDIRQILLSNHTTSHLRTLILEAIKNSKIAIDLASDLHAILLNENGRAFGFRERHDSALAIMKLREVQPDWPEIVRRLDAMGDRESRRLALTIMDDVGYVGFAATQIVEAVLCHLDFGQPAAEDLESFISGELYFIARTLPPALVEGVLNELASRLALTDQDESVDWEQRGELSTFVTRLIVRQIDAHQPDSIRLLRWLRIVQGRDAYAREELQQIAHFLQGHDEIRRAIQYHVIFVEKDHERVGSRLWRMRELSAGLSLSTDDVVFLLNELAAIEQPTERDTEIWRDLAAFARQVDERADEILSAARPFSVGKPLLEQHLSELALPPALPTWLIRENERRHEREQKRQETWAKHRKEFKENEAGLRSGELRWTHGIAHAYLCLFNDSDKSLPPPDRIGQWLGSDLQATGLAGLEAVLTRTDIPSFQQVAESYADSRRWNFVYPLLAAVAERVRSGRGLADLPFDIVATARLVLHHEPLGDRIETEALTTQLDAELRRDPGQYERYVRYLIEPYLRKQLTYIPGLYLLSRAQEDRSLANRLAAEWLFTYETLPISIEDQLVGILADAEDIEALRVLVGIRHSSGYSSDERRQAWLANSILFDFDNATKRAQPQSEDDKPLLWLLRDRLGGRRMQGRKMPHLTAAQLAWIIRRFRHHYPVVERPSGVSSGDQNPWDATDFLRGLISSLAGDPSERAGTELHVLNKDPEDGYTPYVRFAAEQHRRARREASFSGVTLKSLKAVLELKAPATTSDLLAVVRSCLSRLQQQLRGSDTDVIGKYYRDDGQPRDEDSCTDRLIEDIERLLPPYGIKGIPQRDMPHNKRVDVVFALGDFALPIECKGQWNRDLWTAATEQLDSLYLNDWRAQDRGLLLVYWFGSDVKAVRRLRKPPPGTRIPQTPDDLRDLLLAQVPLERRTSIAIEVLDLTNRQSGTPGLSAKEQQK